jgi:hypothetical protein
MQCSKLDSKKPRDQTREDNKLRGPTQKSVESCGTRSYVQLGEKLTTRAHMQKGEGSRRLGNRRRAKEAGNWAEVGPGRLAQGGWPGPIPGPSHPTFDLAAIRGREPRINPFVIGRRGAEKGGTPSRSGEGRAS